MAIAIPLGYTEEELIQSCINNEEWACKHVYENTYNQLLGVSIRYTSSQDAAIDILHDSFVKIFRNMHKYEAGTSLLSWMRRIVVNTSIDHYRREKIRYTEEINDSRLGDHAAENLSLSEFSLEEIVKAIKQLSPTYRTVFNLFVIEGYSHKEIADQLGITESTSRSNLAKARINLQKLIVLKELYHGK